jgi:hypothetical protein
MLFRDTALLDRIFRAFDLNDDNQILFDEYLTCLATISSKSTKEAKILCKSLKKLYSFSVIFSLLRSFFQNFRF